MLRRLLAGLALIVVCLLTPLAADAAPNPFAFPECTWWAAQARPDLIGRVWGDAWQWLDEARWSGLPTGSAPRVGAVAVLQPGVEGADGYGHVGYVVAVDGDTFEVSQTNWWPFPWRVTYRWFVAYPGEVGFIYGG